MLDGMGQEEREVEGRGKGNGVEGITITKTLYDQLGS
jgi:hypothetical protein